MAFKSKNWILNERENSYFQPKEKETTAERVGKREFQGFFLKWKLKQKYILEDGGVRYGFKCFVRICSINHKKLFQICITYIY